MGRRRTVVLVTTAIVVALALVSAVVVAGVVVGRALGGAVGEDRWLDTGGTTASPSPGAVASAVRFAALAPLPPQARVESLHVEQGIDALVELRVAMRPDEVRPWLAASGMPAPVPPAAPAGITHPPDTAVVEQHRASRPDGGIVTRRVTVRGGVVEVRAFET